MEYIILALVIVTLAAVVALLLRKPKEGVNERQIEDASRRGVTEELRALREEFDRLRESQSRRLDRIHDELQKSLTALQSSNEKKLEEMRQTVHEKLEKTLENRLQKSFETVSVQLESVNKGLGEMKTLAAEAKSLKNVLTNVKERGTYGEVRLEKLLSDILAPGQYEANVEISEYRRVDFAVKLPGGESPLILPIDSKFPIEDYNRLLDAEDKQEIADAKKALAQRIRSFAKDICDKYIMPPKTTDFALMFLPTEGLYAEVIQNAVLFEELRDKYKVTAVGPATLAAFLGSLQMGFKTLAIEQRSMEVWETLGLVKKEFENFEGVLTSARNRIRQADDDLEKLIGTRTNQINRKLRAVQTYEGDDTQKLLGMTDDLE